MKKSKSKFNLSVLFLLLSLFIAGSFSRLVKAADIPAGALVNSVSIDVQGVHTDKSSYKAGDTVQGYFVIGNHSAFALTDLSSQLFIGGDYTEHAADVKDPKTLLDAGQKTGGISIAKDGSVTVPFTYKIPLFLGGDKLGVHIAVFTDAGQLIGWNDSPYISIKKGVSSLHINSAKIGLSTGSTFSLGEGPTIYKDQEPKEASFILSLTNDSNSSITIYPDVSAYEQGNIKNTFNTTGASFSLKAKEKKDVSIPLPTLSYKSGIYIGGVTLKDKDGNQLASVIEGRYIIGGKIATVKNISTDKIVLSQGENFKLKALVTGEAPDISSKDAGTKDSGEGSITVSLFNEQNVLVAEDKEAFSLSDGVEISKDLTSKVDSKSLRAEVVVYDDSNNVILDYNKNLDEAYAEKSQAADLVVSSQSGLSFYIEITGLVILILIIIGAIYVFARKIKAPISLIIFIICILGIPTASLLATVCTSISNNSPYNNQIFFPGQTISVSGTTSYTACSNNTSYVNMAISSDFGQSVNLGTVFYTTKTGSAWQYYTSPTFYTSLTAPTTPGNYNVYFTEYVTSLSTVCDGHSLTIAVPIQVVSGVATGLVASCPIPGTTQNLSWTPVSGATGYTVVSNYTGNGWGGTCNANDNLPGDYCGNTTSNSISLPSIVNATYQWWLYSLNSGFGSAAAIGSNFTCLNPGVCGSANGTTLTNYPTGTSACSNGTASGMARTGNTLNWNCVASSATACSANVVSSSCGSLNNSSVPSGGTITNSTSNLCSAGNSLYGNVASNPSNSTWSWSCQYPLSYFSPPWYSTYSARKLITIDHTKVSSTQTDFPVLINLPSDSNLAATATSSGSDVFFTASDGITKLSSQIDSFVKSSGHLRAWVKIPSLSSTSDTQIYMYYGGPAISTNPTDVWSNGFKAVYHLNESSGGSGAIKDSTANAYNMTDSNSPTFTGTGVTFNGTNQYASTPSTMGLTNANVNISCWVNLSSASLKGPCVKIGTANGFGLGVGSGNFDTAGNHLIGLYEIVRWIDTGVNIGTGWHYLSMNIDSAGHPQLFLDGVSKYSDGGTVGATPTTQTNVGGYVAGNRYLNGTVDEAHISNVARSSGWVTTEFNNQSSASTFSSLGAQDTLASYTYSPGVASCNAACTSGTNYCSSSGTCSASCNDWCPNIAGNQTDASLYTIDSSGNCTLKDSLPLINSFSLSIGYGTTSCPAIWSASPSGGSGSISCSIDNSSYNTCSGSGNLSIGLHTFTAQSSVGVATSSVRCSQVPAYKEK